MYKDSHGESEVNIGHEGVSRNYQILYLQSARTRDERIKYWNCLELSSTQYGWN